MGKTLAEELAEFNEEVVTQTVSQRLDRGDSPIDLIKELQEGMRLVGERFDSGTYFLSELLMAADLFTRVMDQLEPLLQGRAMEKIGRMVIGTPKGDIHDLGKNIFATVARGAGFDVHDLGVDVPVEKFVSAVEDLKPDVVGFSALITTAFEMMKQVMATLEEKGLRDDLKVIVGGGVTTDKVREYIGADAQTNDAVEGVRFCKAFLGL